MEAKKTSEVAGSATTAQRKQAVMPLEFKAWMVLGAFVLSLWIPVLSLAVLAGND